ncbi:hypothetical protein CC86DRAFT_463849 [Ophiobolus disseminans]|uniref:BZIP domain-containing protein n=1 Tax=Ophiobolus disseminans TaxID=1469910 RepID=A0A6A7AB89_9PLEO|nr:hypothetical protein CC86DRAFT_463849 [Ophiobolus disseminans]
MSAARIKKTKTPDFVPGEGDPDRKRVLNVLAQRRYRQRRRERITALEAQAKDKVQPFNDQAFLQEKSATESRNTEVIFPDRIPEDGCIVDDVAGSHSPSTLPMPDFDHELLEMSFMQDYTDVDYGNLPTPLPSTPHSPPLQPPMSSDGALLRIPILDALHAFSTVAFAFGVMPHVWDPSYLHVVPSPTAAVAALPKNLQPVSAQLTIPHHPMLDLLPWPTVRERLICMFSMPSAFRPPVAQEDDGTEDCCYSSAVSSTSPSQGLVGGGVKQSKAIMRLTLDLECVQGGEGLRVHSNTTSWSEGNELTEDAWEIGDEFYRKWWWCLDQRIVETSNQRRRERGLPRLKMTAEGQ